MILVTEMFREGEWQEVRTSPQVEVTATGGTQVVTVTSWCAPPWRILGDGKVLFERAA